MTQGFKAGDTSPDIDFYWLKTYTYEMGAIRPPSEGGSASLLLRVTRNCPWSRCAFCYARMYSHQKFELRPVAEVKADIDAVKAIADELKSLSWKLGHGGKVEPLAVILQNNLLNASVLDEHGQRNAQCVVNVFNWLCSGGKTVFLQDADTLIMPADQLVEVIRYLREQFPDIERITSYARSKTISKKMPEELTKLRQVGLARLHVGMETGDDELLKLIDKGVTSEGPPSMFMPAWLMRTRATSTQSDAAAARNGASPWQDTPTARTLPRSWARDNASMAPAYRVGQSPSVLSNSLVVNVLPRLRACPKEFLP